jgi:hypothetical protein
MLWFLRNRQSLVSQKPQAWPSRQFTPLSGPERESRRAVFRMTFWKTSTPDYQPYRRDSNFFSAERELVWRSRRPRLSENQTLPVFKNFGVLHSNEFECDLV